jgi:fermentation-respiration switch protein FrsA (DUF1100 family)
VPAASAATDPLGRTCEPRAEVRLCAGSVATRVPTWDGVPLDVDVTLPATGDGPFPTLVMLHGWGGSKASYERNDDPTGGEDRYSNVWFAKRGYAVVNYSARGFGDSCGRPASRAHPGCAQGWIHLGDQRFEARDTQHLLGLLVDQGVARPDALAVTGVSYGGGQSVMLAYLNDRTRMPDGSFAPWRSPNGTPLKLAAAWPQIPWSSLVSALTPNGRFLDYGATREDEPHTPLGIPKTSYISGLFASGAASGFYSPPGVDRNADLTTWYAQINRGEPEAPDQRAIATEISEYHQGFGLELSPAGAPPVLIQQGWTDDLFPAPEALRAYNDLRAQDPNGHVALQFADLGHARGQNKQPVDEALNTEGTEFLDQHVLRSGSGPAPGSVVAYTQTCPKDAPAGGPFRASSWERLHPGAVRQSFVEEQTVQSGGGDPDTARALDPVAGGGACVQVNDRDASGTAVYRLPVKDAFTLMGQPTITARIATSGVGGQLAGRLWDVAPDGKQVLVARGPFRLTDNQTGEITWQLHGNGYRFEPGHAAKLEVLGKDSPYLRPSNTPFSVRISDLTLDLPVFERPGSGQVAQGARRHLLLRVNPRRPRAGRMTRFRVTVYAYDCKGCKAKRARRARVVFGGKRMTTNSKGQASVRLRLKRAGTRKMRATLGGYRSDSERIRVRRR